ncbi:MAG: hypothetical protein M3Q58_16325 [Bacteroidota bacterium]|nr:hypothetical protein [Bacteroidota bacterium]
MNSEDLPKEIKKELGNSQLYFTNNACPKCNYSGIFAVVDMYTPWYYFIFPWVAGWVAGMGLKNPILKCPKCLTIIKI